MKHRIVLHLGTPVVGIEGEQALIDVVGRSGCVAGRHLAVN